MNAADYDELMISLGLEPSSPGVGRPRSKTRGTAKRKQGRPTVDHGHGDYRTYIKGCRCQECREAHRVRMIERRAVWANDPTAADRAGHGKKTTYRNYGCRCEPCTRANTADVNAYRARRREREALAETGGVS